MEDPSDRYKEKWLQLIPKVQVFGGRESETHQSIRSFLKTQSNKLKLYQGGQRIGKVILSAKIRTLHCLEVLMLLLAPRAKNNRIII